MAQPLDADVAVIGAGPAGSAAATVLARAGLRVVLADRARFPRDKCCGDGLTTGALRRLDSLGLDLRAVPSFTPVGDLTVRSPSGRIARLPLGRPDAVGAAVARRSDLDAALVDLARSAGATVVEGRAFEDLEVAGSRDRGGIAVHLADGLDVHARYVVGADGAWSPVRRAAEQASGDSGAAARPPAPGGAPGAEAERVGPDEADGPAEVDGPARADASRRAARRRGRSGRERPEVRAAAVPQTGGRRDRGEWHAFRAYATGVGPEAAEHLWVWFDRSTLPGYAWSFPLSGGIANVGICLRRAPGRRGSELAAAWSALLDGPFLASLLGRDAVVEGPAKSWPIPAGIEGAPLSALSGRVLFTGDAARAADPFTGEGVAQALHTGVAAARAIAEVGAVSAAAVAERYGTEIDRTLGREHQLSWACSSILAHPLGARGAVRVSGTNEWTRRNVGRWLYEDYPRAIVISPSLWRPGVLGRRNRGRTAAGRPAGPGAGR